MNRSIYICEPENFMHKGNYKLAVFDSDKAMLEACTLILKEQDIEIDAFANSTNLADRFQGYTPSAILLDNSILPDGGLQVLRFFKQHVSLCKVPIIYMTANGVKGDEALREGANFLLIKPFDLPQLTHTVLQACSSRGYEAAT